MLKTIFVTLILTAMIFPFQFADKRRILLFSKDAGNPAFEQQQKILIHDSTGLRERDIVVETYVLTEKNKAVFTKHKVLGWEYGFILIGKDGGQKLRSNAVVPSKDLFRLIDDMPMRRSEMKKQ